MNATAFEFRHRFWMILAIFVLGFWAPWDTLLHLDGAGPNAHVWGWLAVLLSKSGVMGITSAFDALLLLGIACAAAGAILRTWGSAYLGVDGMGDPQMRGDEVVADGPYRHLRNPLYVGSWLGTLALALLMPPSGAVFTILMLAGFLVRLILGEESFLSAKLGEAYTNYCARVPRLLPSLAARIAASGARPRWPQAVLAEIFLWGVTASFAVFGWQYNAHLLLRCVLVSLGASLVVKGLAKQQRPAA